MTHQDASMTHQDASMTHQDASVKRQDASVRHQDTSMWHQDPSVRRQDASVKLQDAFPKSQDRCREVRHALRAAAEVEPRAQNAPDAARDAAIASQWEHHNLILGVKAQANAQFGADSDEVASLGLKKKSERKAPARSSSKASK